MHNAGLLGSVGPLVQLHPDGAMAIDQYIMKVQLSRPRIIE
jgi:hypothetical protein